MSLQIIIRGKTKFGRVRSEQEENLRKEGLRSMTDEQLDKIKFIEKKAKELTNNSQNFVKLIEADMVK